MALWKKEIEITAPAGDVWSVMSDVARWPEWTPSILSVENVSPEFGVGGSALVHAKGTPKSTWTVTRWEPGKGFDWETKSMGAKTIGGHWIESMGEISKVTLTIEVNSPLAALLKPLIGRGITRNMAVEATELKRASQALAEGVGAAAPA